MDSQLPNLVVVGAMKSATTSLHHYLDLHPEIAMATERGLDFFLEERQSRGAGWYASHFDGSSPVRGDTSPRYTNAPLDPGVAERMHALLPDARLVYLVRDPIERTISHYTHYFAAGYEDRPLREALLDLGEGPERNPYLCRSLYWMQLSAYRALYPDSRIRVVYTEDLRDRRRETLRGLFRFLDVREDWDSRGFDRVHHVTGRKRRSGWMGRAVRGLVDPAIASFHQDTRDRLRSIAAYPFSRPVERPVPDAALLSRLRELLQADASRIQRFVGHPGPGWSL